MVQKNARRRFLAKGSLALCVPLVVGRWARAASSEGELTASRFIPLIGTAFEGNPLSTGTAAPLTLWLRSVEPLRHALAQPTDAVRSERSFLLDFALENAMAGQDTFAIRHPRLGTFSALLVPSRNGKTLTAVFNRLG